ncbi:hypothetical protein FQN57_002674 [Myotisia sp. PD_48]|nr:hypothetical protein FQN57_002674 [Myotisia sp. PD_48]
MGVQMGLDSHIRSDWNFVNDNHQWISMNYVNPSVPVLNTNFSVKSDQWNFGFNDFVIVEFTPELRYEEDNNLIAGVRPDPPVHPRANSSNSHSPEGVDMHMRHRIFSFPRFTSYNSMAYGWGKKGDVLDRFSTVNKYIKVEGPVNGYTSMSPLVKLMMLPIPGGLKNSDMFWIDLNKGVRALYFPARFVLHDDKPDRAAYAKISFVERYERNLMSAKEIMDENTIGKHLFDLEVDLTNKTRKTEETVKLPRANQVGAYSIHHSLIIDIPRFIESSFWVATDPKAPVFESIYLAESANIQATPFTDESLGLFYETGTIGWTTVYKMLKDYAEDKSADDQVNLKQVSLETSGLDPGLKVAIDLLLMASSFIPYVGPVFAASAAVFANRVENLGKDPGAETKVVESMGISKELWSVAPAKTKDTVLKGIAKAVRVLKRRQAWV